MSTHPALKLRIKLMMENKYKASTQSVASNYFIIWVYVCVCVCVCVTELSKQSQSESKV